MARNAVGTGVDVEHQVVSRWVGEELRAALDRLPTRQRDVLLLRFVEDLDVATTAQRLGLSVPAVKMTQHRGTARLRILLPAEVVGLFERNDRAPSPPSTSRSTS